MEFVIDARSFRVSAPQIRQRRVRQENIVGPRFRSRGGCLCCKRRKKKCDEQRPQCGPCSARGTVCEWARRGRRPKLAPAVAAAAPDMLPPAISPDLLTLPLLASPAVTYATFLDEAGLGYLEFFQTDVAPLLCVTCEGTNHLVKTFFAVAMYDEGVLNALAAWGGYFRQAGAGGAKERVDGCGGASGVCVRGARGYRQFPDVSRYMARAHALMRPRARPLDKLDRYTLLCFHLIEMGLEICSGDVANWYCVFERMHATLTEGYGGLLQMCDDFGYSNDIKWLASNVQFHDIMLSVTQLRGTLFAMGDYHTLFTKWRILDVGGYGLDPFQGIIQPVYLLLGEVMNVYVRQRERRRALSPAWEAKREPRLEASRPSEGHGGSFWSSGVQDVLLELSEWHGESFGPSEWHQEPRQPSGRAKSFGPSEGHLASLEPSEWHGESFGPSEGHRELRERSGRAKSFGPSEGHPASLEPSEWLEALELESCVEWQEAPCESLRQALRLRQARLGHFRALDATYRAFDARVTLCRPSAVQMSMIRLPGTLRLHMGLFEVVRNTCRLYMLLYLRQVQPASPAVQQILLESMELLEALANTTIVAALPMVLLVCGIACLEPSDRRAMAAIYRRVYAQYTVGNVARVWAVVEEFWARNPGGQLCIDWADICEERGWSLSVC